MVAFYKNVEKINRTILLVFVQTCFAYLDMFGADNIMRERDTTHDNKIFCICRKSCK